MSPMDSLDIAYQRYLQDPYKNRQEGYKAPFQANLNDIKEGRNK
jgi:hypothetical protein